MASYLRHITRHEVTKSRLTTAAIFSAIGDDRGRPSSWNAFDQSGCSTL